MKTSQASAKRRSHSDTVGYVVADDVIGVRDPNYDQDNIALETAELFANGGGRDTRVIVTVRSGAEDQSLPRVNASRSAIQKALNQLR